LLADLLLLGNLSSAAAIGFTQHGDDLLVGEMTFSHRLALSLEDPSFQQFFVQRSRAGQDDLVRGGKNCCRTNQA
jgi:hypothetical protein